ncbi:MULTISPECIES: hypothetical protein [Halorubrum]|uniref:hypothetical protein n=1 Tax=Halorubrum TaxID=56688 RepID=UPI000AC15C72|nr:MULTISPECIES: hypothetical protein [Halorubrum]
MDDPAETGAGGVKHALAETVMRRSDEAGIGFPYPRTELVGSLGVNQIGRDATADD